MVLCYNSPHWRSTDPKRGIWVKQFSWANVPGNMSNGVGWRERELGDITANSHQSLARAAARMLSLQHFLWGGTALHRLDKILREGCRYWQLEGGQNPLERSALRVVATGPQHSVNHTALWTTVWYLLLKIKQLRMVRPHPNNHTALGSDFCSTPTPPRVRPVKSWPGLGAEQSITWEEAPECHVFPEFTGSEAELKDYIYSIFFISSIFELKQLTDFTLIKTDLCKITL